MNEIARTTVDKLLGLEIAQDLAEMNHDVQIRESRSPIASENVRRADTIRRLHLEVAAHVTIALGKAMEIGQLLTEQKAAMNHGEWMPWLKGIRSDLKIRYGLDWEIGTSRAEHRKIIYWVGEVL